MESVEDVIGGLQHNVHVLWLVRVAVQSQGEQGGLHANDLLGL